MHAKSKVRYLFLSSFTARLAFPLCVYVVESVQNLKFTTRILTLQPNIQSIFPIQAKVNHRFKTGTSKSTHFIKFLNFQVHFPCLFRNSNLERTLLYRNYRTSRLQKHTYLHALLQSSLIQPHKRSAVHHHVSNVRTQSK